MGRQAKKLADAWKAAQDAADAARRATTVDKPKPVTINPVPAPATGGDMIPVPPARDMTPASNPADLDAARLDASARPVEDAVIAVPGERMDLDGKPKDDIIEAEFEIKPDPVATPDPVVRQPDPVVTPDPVVNAPDAEPMWKKALRATGLVGGGMLIRELLKQTDTGGGGQRVPPGVDVGHGDPGPPIPPPPMSPKGPGPGGYPLPINLGDGSKDLGAKPEDRIRALRNFQMRLNPNTQTLQSWTR